MCEPEWPLWQLTARAMAELGRELSASLYQRWSAYPSRTLQTGLAAFGQLQTLVTCQASASACSCSALLQLECAGTRDVSNSRAKGGLAASDPVTLRPFRWPNRRRDGSY